MSSSQGPARPPQVTAAGWGIAIAALMLVVSVFDAMANLRSVDVREEITRAITSGSAKGFGLSVDDALEITRWCLFVAGFAGVAAGIFGIFVLQRNKGARIGLSVLAVPIVVTASVAGSFLGMFIAAGTAILWTRPARDWFAGRQAAPRPEPQRPQPFPELPSVPSSAPPAPWVPPTPPPAPSSDAVPAPLPPPTHGWGQVPPAGQPYPVPPPPQAPNPYGYYPPAPRQVVGQLPSDRPRQVRVACIVTWVFTGITALAYLAVLAAVIIDSDRLVELLQESPGWDSSYDEDLVIAAASVGSVVFLVWCSTAAVLAFLAWRRLRWAWILLLVSTGVAAVVAALGFPFSLLHLGALATSMGMLLSRPARDWFRR